MHGGKEPIEWQEQHSPTVLVENVVSHQGKRTKEAYRQRRADHRLLESLTPEQRRAWDEIDRVWSHTINGMTAKAQLFERLDRGRNEPAEISAELTRRYRDWRARVAASERSVIVDIICEGKSPYRASRERRRASEWGRYVLGEGLDRWAELAGWQCRQGA